VPTSIAALAGLDDLVVYRVLFAAYPDALLVVDGQGVIVLANPAATTLLGYSTDELIGLPVDALVPEAIRPRHAAYREAYERNPRPRPMGTQMDLVAKRRDGSEVMVEIALSPLRELGLPYVVAAVRGIGDYPRVRQALDRARYAEHVAQVGRLAVDTRNAQLLLDEVPKAAVDALQVETSAVFLLEPSGVEFCVASGVGLAHGEEVGQRVRNRRDTLPGFVHAEGRPALADGSMGEPNFDVVQASPDARRLASELAVPLSDRGRVIGALLVRSRQPRRFGEDEVRFLESLSSLLATSLQRAQTEEQLNHSQRLDSVGQLTGGIAHDFNNLLTVISGNLQVMNDLPLVAADPVAGQMLAAAMRASKRAAELTGKLLAFSRRQVLQPSRVDVGALLGSLTSMLRRTLDQRIEIALDAKPDCPPCLADPGQLEAALLNIAINARDAMPDGGTLSFSCRSVRQVSANLRDELPDASDEAYVAIAISDSGRGMSEAVRDRAFEPFFTTKEAGRGTGLGLSTVYGFAKQSRGAVTLDSALGSGTTVTLYLPRVPADEPAGDVDAAAEGRVPEGLRVLMVEDDAEVRAVVQRFLSSLRCEAIACINAEQALAVLDVDQAFDLLLTDVALGAGMRGTDLARRARERLPRLPVVLMTGFASAVVEAPPGWEMLRKPYTRAELARAIARAIAAIQ
jgi:PAS domain S-box-containing protein